MVQRLPDIQLQSGVQVTTNVPLFVKGFIIGNESGLSCTVEMQGLFNPKNLYPGTVDFFPCAPNFSGNVIINNVTMLSNVAAWPSAFLTVDMVSLQDTIDTSLFPMSLPTRQTTTPTTSGNPIFSATVGFGATATLAQDLNVYNPANSGVIYQFHSARVFDNDTTTPTCNLIYSSGADLNLPNPIIVASHICSADPPASTAHVTSKDNNGVSGGTLVEVIDLQQDITLDFLTFPDVIILEPGNNLRIETSSGSAGHIVRLTLKWTEVPLNGSALSGGGTTPGNILTAANVVNQGNAPGTGIIAAYPLADGTNAVFVDNEGNFVLGSLLRDGDFQIVSATLGGTIFHIEAATNTILFDGAQPFPGDGFTFHSEDGTNQLHVTDAGATFSKEVALSAGLSLPVGSLTRIATFVAAVTTTPTLFNHGLGVVPTITLLTVQGTSATAQTCEYDPATLSSTQVKLTGSGSFNVRVTVIAL